MDLLLLLLLFGLAVALIFSLAADEVVDEIVEGKAIAIAALGVREAMDISVPKRGLNLLSLKQTAVEEDG